MQRLVKCAAVDFSAVTFRKPPFQLGENSMFRLRTDQPVIRENEVPEKINAANKLANRDFFRVQIEREPVAEEFRNWNEQPLKIDGTSRNNREIVGIADIISDPESVFHEPVEFVHVNVREQLRREVAYRQTLGFERRRARRRITFHDLPEKPHRVFVLDSFFENRKKNAMIHRIEELLNIAFQNEAGTDAVFANLTGHPLESRHATMRAVTDPARE